MLVLVAVFQRGGITMSMIFCPFVISADQALKDFVDLGLNKQGKKSATLENVTAILNKNGVQVRQIPSEKVKNFVD